MWRPYPPLFASIICHGIATAEHYVPFLNKKYVTKDLIWSDAVAYYSRREIKTAGDLAFRSWTNQQKFQKARRIFTRREKQLIATATNSDFAEYAYAYEKYMPALILPWLAEKPVEVAVRRILKQKIGLRKTKAVMDSLNIPYQDNFYKQEEYELAKTNDLPAHIKKYEWIFSRYGELNPYTLSQAKVKRAEINTNEFLKNRRIEKQKLKTAITDAKQTLGEPSAHIVDIMQWVVYYRTQRTDIMNRSQYLFAPQLKKIARKKGLTYQEILHCVKEEILGRIPSRAIIRARIKNHAMILEDGNVRCVHGSDADHIREFLREDANALASITGTTACRGKAKGIVRIIRSRSDFTKMQPGDILVTSMTTTNMMPIIKKAAAIVTDEGGITCHAAIISRELKIPCIIGTRSATSALKDGDMVEVNADQGIVKKFILTKIIQSIYFNNTK